jgi:hypothetical protein
MSSAGGATLSILGTLVGFGSLAGWFYLASYCSALGTSQSGITPGIGRANNCLVFYSIDQIRDQGLASIPPVILIVALIFGSVLLISGVVLMAVRK